MQNLPRLGVLSGGAVAALVLLVTGRAGRRAHGALARDADALLDLEDRAARVVRRGGVAWPWAVESFRRRLVIISFVILHTQYTQAAPEWLGRPWLK